MLSELPVKRGGSSVKAPSLSDEQIDVLARGGGENCSLPVPEELANHSFKAVYENVLAIRKSKSVR
jgi:hypothetical protein